MQEPDLATLNRVNEMCERPFHLLRVTESEDLSHPQAA